jgi:hypothetical protein
MTELHYYGLYISVYGSYVSANGTISPVKDLIYEMNGRGLTEPITVKLIKEEMRVRGYGEPLGETR